MSALLTRACSHVPIYTLGFVSSRRSLVRFPQPISGLFKDRSLGMETNICLLKNEFRNPAPYCRGLHLGYHFAELFQFAYDAFSGFFYRRWVAFEIPFAPPFIVIVWALSDELGYFPDIGRSCGMRIGVRRVQEYRLVGFICVRSASGDSGSASGEIVIFKRCSQRVARSASGRSARRRVHAGRRMFLWSELQLHSGRQAPSPFPGG